MDVLCCQRLLRLWRSPDSPTPTLPLTLLSTPAATLLLPRQEIGVVMLATVIEFEGVLTDHPLPLTLLSRPAATYSPSSPHPRLPPPARQEIGVDMLPTVEPVEESPATLRALTEGVHSREAIDMVKVGGWCTGCIKASSPSFSRCFCSSQGPCHFP